MSVAPAPRGLSTEEAAESLARSGPNLVAESRRVSPALSVFRQLRDPLILVLIGAAVLTSATGDFTDAAVIGLVIVVNTAVGVVQEIRADRAVAALSALAAPRAHVRRDGLDRQIAANEVVPGDILLLSQGDVIPADAALLEAHLLLIDESALTGESVPVDKDIGFDEALFAGTVVVNGRAVATVTETGARSSLGRIAALLERGQPATPLQKRLARLGRTLAIIAILLCALVLVLGLARGEPIERMVITAISLAVAAVPESLPAVITLSLALGARYMARRSAIVRHLPAVETLGSVTVLATDKTGTLTTGRMRAELVCTGAGCRAVEELLGDKLDPDVEELLVAGALCNDAVVSNDENGDTAAVGDPTEVALLLAAAGAGIEREALERAHPRVGEVPFDSHRKMMTTVHRAEAGFVVCTKGAPEAVERIRRSGEEREAAAFGVRARELADAGYRVLAVGTARLDNLPADIGDAEKDIHVIGLIAIADPPKERARGTIEECKRAGIVPVLITGDHAATAVAIANRVGIIDDGDAEVATGDQLRAGTIADIAKIRVFARTSPDQKPDIVEAWQRNGAVVAMVGDGVNDGPALRRADIGVAMGRHGTEVARQAADLVLANDDLETVVVAVEEGRRIYSNVRRFLTFGLAGGTAEILVMLFGPAVGFAVPLLAAQILWINLLTHGLTGVALGAEPAEPGAMRRGPRPPKESVLGDGLLARVVRLAIVATVATLAAAVWAKETDRPWQTVTFVTLTTLQLGVALALRARHSGRGNPFLLLAIAVSFSLALAGVYVPALRDLLGTMSLSAVEVVVATAMGVVGWAVTRVDVRLLTRRGA